MNSIMLQDFLNRYIHSGAIRVIHNINAEFLKNIDSEIKIEKIIWKDIAEISILGEMYLPKYKDLESRLVEWNHPDAINLQIAQDYYLLSNTDENYNISHSALPDETDIIYAYDNVLKKGILVDGVHRAVSLYKLFINDKAALQQILESNKTISLVILSSEFTRNLFSCDFSKLS